MSQSTATAAPKPVFNTLYSDRYHYTEPVNKIIRLRCIFGRQPQVLHLVPAVREGQSELLGVERMTPELEKFRDYVVTSRTKVRIFDGIEFNMLNERDRVNWNWVQYCKEIAANLDDSLYEHSEVAYFVEDEEGQLQQKLLKRLRKDEAVQFVRNLTPDKLYDYARLMGQDMSLHSPAETLDYMLDLAENSYEKLLTIDTDPYRTDRLLLYRFIDTGIVREENKTLYYDKIRLGVDEDSALAFMMASKNRDLVDQMKTLYARKFRPAHGGTPPVPVRGQEMLGTHVMSQTAAAPLAGALQLQINQMQRLAPRAYATYFEGKPDADVQLIAETLGEADLKALIAAELRSSLAPMAAANFARSEEPVTSPLEAQFDRLADVSVGEEPTSGPAEVDEDEEEPFLDEHTTNEEVPSFTRRAAPPLVEQSINPDRLGDASIVSTPDQTIPNQPVTTGLNGDPVFLEANGEPFATAPVQHVTSSGPLSSEPATGTGAIPRAGGKFTKRNS